MRAKGLRQPELVNQHKQRLLLRRHPRELTGASRPSEFSGVGGQRFHLASSRGERGTLVPARLVENILTYVILSAVAPAAVGSNMKRREQSG